MNGDTMMLFDCEKLIPPIDSSGCGDGDGCGDGISDGYGYGDGYALGYGTGFGLRYGEDDGNGWGCGDEGMWNGCGFCVCQSDSSGIGSFR